MYHKTPAEHMIYQGWGEGGGGGGVNGAWRDVIIDTKATYSAKKKKERS
jgi:hypothetical protein